MKNPTTLNATMAIALPQSDIDMISDTGMGAAILQNKSICRNFEFNPIAKIN